MTELLPAIQILDRLALKSHKGVSLLHSRSLDALVAFEHAIAQLGILVAIAAPRIDQPKPNVHLRQELPYDAFFIWLNSSAGIR